MDQPARRLGAGVDEPQGAQVILRLMVIDHGPGCRQRTKKRPEVAQLIPGAGVEHEHGIDIPIGIARRPEALHLFVGIEKVVAGRQDTGDDTANLLALPLQNIRQGQHRAETIPIGADMRR